MEPSINHIIGFYTTDKYHNRITTSDGRVSSEKASIFGSVAVEFCLFCRSVSLFIGNNHKYWKNGLFYQDAVWGGGLDGPRGPDPLTGRNNFLEGGIVLAQCNV